MYVRRVERLITGGFRPVRNLDEKEGSMLHYRERNLFDRIIDSYTEVGPSPLHGYGVFARQFIPEGTVWWHARPQDTLFVSEEQFITLKQSFRPPDWYRPRLVDRMLDCLCAYSFYDVNSNALVFCLDNARYVNHSVAPNSEAGLDRFSSVAIRDILPGEEITENYSRYDKASWAKR